MRVYTPSTIQQDITRKIYSNAISEDVTNIRFHDVRFNEYDIENSIKLMIDGDWLAEDFIQSIEAIKLIYYHYFTKQLLIKLLTIGPRYPKEIVILESNFLNPNYSSTYQTFKTNNPEITKFLIKGLSDFW